MAAIPAGTTVDFVGSLTAALVPPKPPKEGAAAGFTSGVADAVVEDFTSGVAVDLLGSLREPKPPHDGAAAGLFCTDVVLLLYVTVGLGAGVGATEADRDS